MLADALDVTLADLFGRHWVALGDNLATLKVARFVREHVTRVKHPDPPSSSHSGSSHGSGTHVSSSGATHGGGGRSF